MITKWNGLLLLLALVLATVACAGPVEQVNPTGGGQGSQEPVWEPPAVTPASDAEAWDHASQFFALV